MKHLFWWSLPLSGLSAVGTCWDSVAKPFSRTFCSNYFCSAAVKWQEQLGWKFDILGYIHACDLGLCWLTVSINDKWGSGWTNYIYSFYRSCRNHGRQVSWKCTCLCSLSTSTSLTNHKSSSYSTGILPRRCSSNEKRCSQMAGHIFGGMWLKMRGKWKGHSFSRIIRNLFISEGYSKSIWTQNGWSLVTFLIGVPGLIMHNVSVYILPRVFLSL